MIELYQLPWSPFCIVTRRILQYAGAKFRTVNVSNSDRSAVWRLTRGRYYQVPVLKDARNVVFEMGDDSQVIAKYLDDKFQLGLFPHKLEGIQFILWQFIENQIESSAFRLNDIHWREFVPKSDVPGFVRHKERKFGRGCLDLWRQQQQAILQDLQRSLVPFEEMLLAHPFLLEDRPRFVDFNLFGILGNFLFSGHYTLPDQHVRLQEWHSRMTRI